jgi:hypothetical protein
LARPGVASGGNVAVRAYADRNGDGRFDDDDEPLTGVKIRSGGRPIETGPTEAAIVTGLGDGASARIEVDLAGLDDPFLTARGSVYSFVPRPGRVAALPLPFVPTGEVTLRMQFDDGGGTPRGLSALGVRLLSGDGSVVALGRTEYHGDLFLEGLRPGRYRVALDPDAERPRSARSSSRRPRSGRRTGVGRPIAPWDGANAQAAAASPAFRPNRPGWELRATRQHSGGSR